MARHPAEYVKTMENIRDSMVFFIFKETTHTNTRNTVHRRQEAENERKKIQGQ